MKSVVSSRGQITIPVAIQRKMGMGPGTPVEFELKDDHVVLRKGKPEVDPVDRYYGILKHKGLPPVDELIREMRGPDLESELDIRNRPSERKRASPQRVASHR